MSSRYQNANLFIRSQFGDLYRATDSESGDEVVLRRMFDAETATAEPDRVASLEHRASQLAAFKHPCVAAVLDAGTDEEGGYVVSEWVEGTRLDEIVSQAALTVDDFDALTRYTLEALEAIHQSKLIHGSLKPNRVVLQWKDDQTAMFKVTDLGLAELLGSADLVTTDVIGRYTGALDCLAPELFDGEPGDARTDLYAVGNIFYYALTQHLPFAGKSAGATIDNHRAGNAIHLQQFRQELPPELADWVMSLISTSPADRPQTAAIALQNLETALLDKEDQEQAGTEEAPTIPAEAEEETEAETESAPATAAAPTAETAKVAVRASEPSESATPSVETPEPKQRSARWIPATLIAILAIGIVAFAIFKLTSSSEPDIAGNEAAPLPSSAANPATPAPLPTAPAAGQTENANSTAPPDTGELPLIDSLLAQFAFAELMPGSSATDEPVTEWPKQSGAESVVSLQVKGVDADTGSNAQKVISTADSFPAMKGSHPLLQLTGKASMVVNWQRAGNDFGSGDQLTYVALMWSPEKNADIIHFFPPIREEGAIATRIADRGLVSEISHFDKSFPVTLYPNGNQMLSFSLIWAGNQDNAKHGIMTPSGKRFTSELSAAPNHSLLLSSLRLGGDASPYSATDPSGVYFAELLVYDRALTRQERASIDRYLLLKYFR